VLPLFVMFSVASFQLLDAIERAPADARVDDAEGVRP